MLANKQTNLKVLKLVRKFGSINYLPYLCIAFEKQRHKHNKLKTNTYGKQNTYWGH